MDERWIEIVEGGKTRHAGLLDGLTRIGGGDADVHLDGVGEDQLHLWDNPPRVVFVGVGVPPAYEGVPFTERVLASGESLRFGEATLRIELGDSSSGGNSPARPPVASIREVSSLPADRSEDGSSPTSAAKPRSAAVPLGAVRSGGAQSPDSRGGTASTEARSLTELEEKIWNRLQAGLIVDQGLGDRGTLERQQKRALEGSLSLDECSKEILASARSNARGEEGGRLLLERSGRLMRDFLMTPLNTRTRAVGRIARRKTQGILAFILAQGLALLVFGLIMGLILFFIRLRGVSLDEFFDRFAPGGG